MPYETITTADDAGVRTITLARPKMFNTITPTLRDELSNTLEEADRDCDVKVVLLCAEGPAFCAGFALDWDEIAAAGAIASGEAERCWDSIADLAMISTYARAFAKLHTISKPTVAAVQGWCLAGGTDMVLNADLLICARSARFGYPPARVWGAPEAPWAWVARLGLQRAKRLLFTGDEISGEEAAAIGLALECVDDASLMEAAKTLARRIALLPTNQLQMMKLLTNAVAHRMYDPEASRLLGCLMDGVARNTQEGRDFVALATQKGWREAVRARDDPFGDYGERRPTKHD